MTVYRPDGGKTYRYDFEFRGTRYWGNTKQLRLEDAREWERELRVRLARRSGGLPTSAADTPYIQEWSEIYFAYKEKQHRDGRLKRPDIIERQIPLVLEFFGRRPTTEDPKPNAPYHDRRLGDLVEHPEYLEDFDDWLRARTRRGKPIGGSARNHYRSVMSGMYKVALLPKFRQISGVTMNPFQHIERDRQTRRRVTIPLTDLRAWITKAVPHVQLALIIGSLAPTLRTDSILGLRWDRNFDESLQFLTVYDHKTDQQEPEPVVVPIGSHLRVRLKAERKAASSPWVIHWHGKRVKSMKTGLRRSAARAGVTYGIKAGITFHTIRHTMATLLAERGVAEGIRKAVLGHKTIATTQIYTHLRPSHLLATFEQLGAEVAVGNIAGPRIGKGRKPRQKSVKGVRGKKAAAIKVGPDSLARSRRRAKAS